MYSQNPIFRVMVSNPMAPVPSASGPESFMRVDADAGKTRWKIFSTAYLNAFAALLHAMQAVLVFGLIAWLNSKPIDNFPIEYDGQHETANHSSGQRLRVGIFALYRTAYSWNRKKENDTSNPENDAMIRGFSITEVKSKTGELDVRYAIAAFFVLSAVFQSLGGVTQNHKKNARLRFIEYSFSASVMILTIAVESGLRDIYVMEMMFVLTWATMMFGMFADILSEMSEKLQSSNEPLFEWLGYWTWIAPHVAGWVTYMSAYAPIFDHYHHSIEKSDSDAKPPGFVNVIVYLQFALFSSFGFVQLYGLVSRTYVIMGANNGMDGAGGGVSAKQGYFDTTNARDDAFTTAENDRLLMLDSVASGNYLNSKPKKLAWIADTTDRMYIGLSFVAKTLLAWLILSPILVNAVK